MAAPRRTDLARILRIYVIRELAIPTLLALLTVTFILLLSKIYQLISLVLQPGVQLGQVMGVLGSFLPSLLIFAAPMAILIGLFIGVGRMVLDNEVLAIRASGISLISIFFPATLGALGVSLLILALSAEIIPKMMLRGMERIQRLQISLVKSLEPGRFYDELGDGSGDFLLRFEERDPQTRQMRGITIKLVDEVASASELQQTLESAQRAGGADAPRVPEVNSTETTLNAPPSPRLKGREKTLTLITSVSGDFETDWRDVDRDGRMDAAIKLKLKNGSVHKLNSERGYRDNVSIRFGKAHIKLIQSSDVTRKRYQTLSNAELRDRIGDIKGVKAERRGEARRLLVGRHTIALASFVFLLMGIPLAIWVRPSGKSWGILIAIGLMLCYFVLMELGLSMVANDKPFGITVAFSPNLLFLALGSGFWWQTMRS
jgi:lipopolysaccharide export LptBFGC system permease protein LptF